MKNPYAKALIEIESGLWEHDARVEENIAKPYSYDDDTFRACLKIFMSATLWKLWEKPGTLKEKMEKAEELGSAIRGVIYKFTKIDTHKLYQTTNTYH